MAGANKYRFRFENANEGYLRNIATNTPTLVLNWVTLPLVNGGIYDVQVQASFDGGTTYCPLGDVCVVNILNVPAQNGRAMETTEVAALGTERPEVWPNPTADGSFDVRWTVPMVQEGTITLEVLDLNGRTLHQERIAMADGFLQAHITPQQHLSSGVYLMRFTAEGHAAHGTFGSAVNHPIIRYWKGLLRGAFSFSKTRGPAAA
ncbi:MAG: T9SS type A sorting domain-containing protein [Flavobacteriales bacterium]|nr:T9SS type A sorting domain-containing protein [Flavobacteriales bacterium]